MLDLSTLKVTFVALTLGQGGAERQLYYMLKALKESGASPRLLSLTQGEFWEQPIRDLGVPIIWVGQSKSRVIRLIRIIIELRQHRPHILQSQYFFTNFYVALTARLLRLPEIGAIRNDAVTGLDAAGKIASWLSLRIPRFIAANSQAAIYSAMSLGVSSRRLQLLSNVVDTDHFKPLIRVNQPIRLLAVGRLIQQKRFDRFISVLAQLLKYTHLSVTGTIVGGGPLRDELEHCALQAGLLPDKLEFVGSIDDTAHYYRKADIFVLTSDWEGTPNVLLEAMASGLPVIATRVGGVSDIIQNGKTGYLIAPEDEELMVEKLVELILDSEQRATFGRQARSYVMANHSLHLLPQLLTQLYETRLKGSN